MAIKKAKSKQGGREESDREEEKDSEEESDNEGQEEGPVSWLEHVATAISALLVATMLGILIYDATRESLPPAFETKIGGIQIVGEKLRIPVEIRNTGDEAGHNVQLHLELRSADSVLAESETTIDWLAGRSKHDAVGFFEKPTVPYTAKAEVRGYTEP